MSDDPIRSAKMWMSTAIDRATPSYVPTDLGVQVAQAKATIALADEQRTANLIAWHGFVDRQGDLPDEARNLSDEIMKRLGL